MAFHTPEAKEGGCQKVMGETRLGSSWYYCNKAAQWRCTIAHGEEVYCDFHYKAAKRRTRYDKIISAEPIGES